MDKRHQKAVFLFILAFAITWGIIYWLIFA
ncbi:hypothetical protein JEOSCH030_01261 [Phocicoccus schoeneichii]|uniref:Uncharacterized protein n=1 Tax=Phocicoccus schoeneichii TaxID=1812261 RepID=A0A6V7RHJ2_9BACL|nr:hypothetical protein JEOSCH030_01261 [Jeotgalicoccus schoeneichii]